VDRTLLSVDGLTVRYGPSVALRDVTFDLRRGHSLAVIGGNGSGKSTLLNAVAGLVPADTGSVRVDPAATALVLQATAVDPGLRITVRDTVRMARYPEVGLLGRFTPDDRAAVATALERLRITELADHQLHDLSGGQRQRVLVAQGLAQEADLLLLDEPASGLDVVSQRIILEVLDQECASGRAVVMATHDLSQARELDRVLLLAHRQVAYGPPAEVLRPGPLREAFGGAVITFGEDGLLVDDPHHGH
jgi:manganese transport system ATP-binding protein